MGESRAVRRNSGRANPKDCAASTSGIPGILQE
nr:MAG TPA: hypothetical protein [Caudoviricetes sp.]